MSMQGSSKAETIKEYLDELDEPHKSDLKKLDALIRKTVPSLKPFMLTGMPAYGKYHYKSKSGREGDWGVVMMSSRKNYISLYICATDGSEYIPEMYKKQLPKASIGKSCIRFKKLEDVDLKIIQEMLKKGASWEKAQKKKK